MWSLKSGQCSDAIHTNFDHVLYPLCLVVMVVTTLMVPELCPFIMYNLLVLLVSCDIWYLHQFRILKLALNWQHTGKICCCNFLSKGNISANIWWATTGSPEPIFLLIIVLSVFRITASGYHFGSFKFFFP